MDRILAWIVDRLSRQRVFAYALLDDELNGVEARWLVEVVGAHPGGEAFSPDEMFPEIIGLEEQLRSLAITGVGLLEIPQIIRHLASGEIIYYNLRVEPVRDFDAQLLLVALDASEQSRLEQQLVQQRNELRLSVDARQRAEAALRQARDQLEMRVRERTAELEAANIQLRALSRRLVETQENERREIARELHDEIGQALTGLKLLLKVSAHLSEEDAQINVVEAQALVDELMGKVRQLSLDLRPAMLDDLGLLPALIWHCDRYTSRTQIRVHFQHSGIEKRFTADVETAAYRIIQEALTNTARYADVDEVFVRVIVEEKILTMQIRDHGKGFMPRTVMEPGKSTGLSGMRERAEALGGAIFFEAAPHQGVAINVKIPLGGIA